MRSFKDSKGRSWNVELTVDSVEMVKQRLAINVLDIADQESELLSGLIAFPPTCGAILWVLCEDQAKAAGVSDVDFRRLLNGDAISDGTDALIDEVVSFSPRSRRTVLQAMFDRMRDVENKGAKLVLEQLNAPGLMEAAERRMRDKMEKHLAEVLGTRSSTAAGPPPESSESTPGASPGDS